MRKLASALLTLGLGLAVAVAGVTPAQAATPSPFGPVNVSPSTVVGAVGKENSIAFLYKYMQTPGFWRLAEAVQAGTATTAQTAELAAATKSYSVPATKLATVAKGTGAVGAGMLAAQVGFSAGKFGSAAFGMDVNRGLCNPTFDDKGLVALVTGTDCGQFYDMAAGFAPNTDVSAGTAWGPQSWAGYTAQFIGTDGGAYFGGLKVFCFKITGSYDGSLGAYDEVYPRASFKTTAGDSGGANMNTWHPGCRYVPGYDADSSIVNSAGWAYSGDMASYGMTMEARRGTRWSDLAAPGTVLPETMPSDPDRRYECTNTFTDGTTKTALSKPWKESSGATAPIPEVEIPAGLIVDTASCGLVTDGKEGRVPLVSTKTTPEYQADAATRPECQDGTCALELYKGDVACHLDTAACADWFTDPNKTSTYTCRMGKTAVALTECNLYAPSFKPENIASGQVIGDPVTGEAKPNPGPNPQKGADAGAFSDAVKDPAGDRECFPTGWGVLNPLNWVLQPAKCALEWAFVPKESAMDDAFDKMGESTSRTALGGIPALLGGFGSMVVEEGGCQGPPLTFNAFGISETSYPFSACTEPMAGVAATVKTLGAGVILLVSTMACTRYLAGIIGFTAFGISSAGGDSDDVTVNMRTGEVKG